jgi:phosphatidylglycerophosphatase A
MKKPIERRNPKGPKDYIAIVLTTFGVGYIPLAPGTWGSAVGVVIYLAIEWLIANFLMGSVNAAGSAVAGAAVQSLLFVLLVVFVIAGIWAAGRSTSFFGNSDPSHAVVDEVQGQLITFLFIPFTYSWKLILAGFLLFRLFDIWKPYPIDDLQELPAGIGICADDIVAGVYAGVCLSIIYAVGLAI